MGKLFKSLLPNTCKHPPLMFKVPWALIRSDMVYVYNAHPISFAVNQAISIFDQIHLYIFVCLTFKVKLTYDSTW